jgi:hypothetical protein
MAIKTAKKAAKVFNMSVISSNIKDGAINRWYRT